MIGLAKSDFLTNQLHCRIFVFAAVGGNKFFLCKNGFTLSLSCMAVKKMKQNVKSYKSIPIRRAKSLISHEARAMTMISRIK